MQSNTLYMFVGALVAGLIGSSVWMYQEQPGFDLAVAHHGVLTAER